MFHGDSSFCLESVSELQYKEEKLKLKLTVSIFEEKEMIGDTNLRSLRYSILCVNVLERKRQLGRSTPEFCRVVLSSLWLSTNLYMHRCLFPIP